MYQHELSVALAAAHQAARVIMEVYATDFEVGWKARNDPVTEADRRANDTIVRTLSREFPHDGICAEEGNAKDCLVAARRGGRCWFVDPLDGTREFIARNGEFAVMIGLAVNGTPVMGVVTAPAWNRTFWAVTQQGAYERTSDGNERPLTVPPPPADIRQARMVVSRSHQHPQVMAVARSLGITNVRPVGSIGLKVALVATGEADLYVHAGRGPHLWDGCAPEAIARSAGAAVTDAYGRPLRYDGSQLALDQGIIVAAPSLHALAVRAFTDALP